MPAAANPTRFNARFTELRGLLDCARTACKEAGLDAATIYRVELVLEEAFANSIHHGYRGETDHPVWLAVHILPEGLELVYRDAAPPFDPLQDTSLPADGSIGGVGRVLMKTLPQAAHYAFADGNNILTFQFARIA